MANPGETSSPEIHCMFVETSLNTRLALLVHKDEIISDFKEKLRNEHKQVFPEIGEINVSALKVKRGRKFYHFSESMNVFKAFDGISRNWFMHVDAVRVEKVADQNGLNLELVEKKKKEIVAGSVLVDGMDTKDLTPEEGLDTEKKTRKRKVRSSDGKTKKSKVDVNQSAVATTELNGKVEGHEVASQSCGDDILTDATIGKVIESGERNDVSIAENQQRTNADTLSEERISNQTVKEALEKLDDLTGAIEQDFEKGGIIMVDQEKDLQLASERVDGKTTSRDDERGDGSRLATEKKRKRPKSSKHHITAGATTTSRKIVDEINVVPGTVDCVDAISKSCPISERETLGNPLVEAVQKDLISSTGPATEKKKKEKKKSSKDRINQSTAATTTSKEIVNERQKVSGSIYHVDSTSNKKKKKKKNLKQKAHESPLKTQPKRTMHCKKCGGAGHNSRSCAKRAKRGHRQTSASHEVDQG